MSLGFYSYGAATVGFGFFALMLLVNWHGSLQGRVLALAVVTTTLWAALATGVAINPERLEHWGYQTFEVLRYIAWYIFLLLLFSKAVSGNAGQRRYLHRVWVLSIAFASLLILFEYYTGIIAPEFEASDRVTLIIVGHLFLPIIGLSFVEQLFRSTAVQYRWATKYLFLAIGGIFAFDFFLYADALLFRFIDRELWEVRGFINLMAVPMLVVAATRNRDWSLNIFISRQVVFNTTAVLGGGLYLLVMAGAGYYVNEFGGTWGRAAQIVFFSLAFVLLLMVVFSAALRAHLRVFIGKHFYSNKYDYRVEWLRLTRTLNDYDGSKSSLDVSIKVLAEIVEARAGSLWLRDASNNFENLAVWNTRWVSDKESVRSSLVQFFDKKSYVINLLDFDAGKIDYEGLEMPAWLAQIEAAWLIVPLIDKQGLLGFVVLAKPLIVRPINWEDRDLLKTAAFQLSTYLAGIQASEALAKSKQFEVFNRLSAYMVHDLKNLAAELELLNKNAAKHKRNPEFIDDAFETIANTSSGIQRLLEQLRNKQALARGKTLIQLPELLSKVAELKSVLKPAPTLELACNNCQVLADGERLNNVLAHIIENAQQATADDGCVNVTLECLDNQCIVKVADTGHGMDAEFLKQRLFKPFDTTKGNAGMGIGMYESREFIQGSGGDIRVDSEPGKGTEVYLYFPSVAKN